MVFKRHICEIELFSNWIFIGVSFAEWILFRVSVSDRGTVRILFPETATLFFFLEVVDVLFNRVVIKFLLDIIRFQPGGLLILLGVALGGYDRKDARHDCN